MSVESDDDTTVIRRDFYVGRSLRDANVQPFSLIITPDIEEALVGGVIDFWQAVIEMIEEEIAAGAQ